MTEQNYQDSDLVFMVSGGIRNGELLPISTRKCMLGIEGWTDRNGQPSCAIFRGPAGVTLRNYADQILVNGESKSTHWLVNGDQIQFPNSISLMVNQLGCIPAEFVMPETHVGHSIESTFNSTMDAEIESDRIEAQLKLDRLESQISEIAQQNQQVTGRFNELDQRLTQLTEQLSTLVTLAGNGQVMVSTSHENSAINLQPIRRAAETVVDFPIAEANIAVSPPAEFTPVKSSALPKPRYQDPALANEWANIEAWHRPEVVEPFIPDPVVDRANDSPHVPSTDDRDDRQDSVGSDASEPPEVIDEEVETDYRTKDIAELFSPNTNDWQSPINSMTIETDIRPQSQHQEISGFFENSSFSPSVFESHNVSLEPAENSLPTVTDPQFETVVPCEAVELVNPGPPVPVKTESVADILARMKLEGQWGGLGDDDEPVVKTPVVQAAPEPEVLEIHAPAPPRRPAPTEQEDVEDYMSQLLSRMRGGQEPAVQPVKAAVSTESKIESVESAGTPASGPMTQEEFIPKQKAAKIESLDAMREIANTSARTAVASSEDDRRKALSYVQLAIAVGSGIMAAYYYFVLCKSFGDAHFLIGTFCLGLTGFLGFRYYSTMNPKADVANPRK